MIDKFIVPSLIDKPDELKFSEGLLFRLPAELGGANKLKAYSSKTTLGWHNIDHGYLMYIHRSEELGLVRFIGILPAGHKANKISSNPFPFSKADFELYVESLVEGERRTRNRVKNEISLLIHDLRRFSNSIYQNAVATKKAIFDGDGNEASVRIDNTLAAQAMLSIRTDILDLAESDDVQQDQEKVPVYRKFDKVVKSFKPGCSLKKVDISISGSSHSVTIGPDCVEIIAYILVDNALKYSPPNHTITVSVAEQEHTIDVEVTSLGPIFTQNEADLIFERGYRSKGAQAIEASGTGYGLYLAKSLVARFKGSISAEQVGEIIKTNRGELRDSKFRVSFPIYERHERPLYTNQEKKGSPQKLQPVTKRRSPSGAQPISSQEFLNEKSPSLGSSDAVLNKGKGRKRWHKAKRKKTTTSP